MPEAYCANCDKPLRKGMRYLGWGLCDPCDDLPKKTYDPLTKMGLSKKDREHIIRRIRSSDVE